MSKRIKPTDGSLEEKQISKSKDKPQKPDDFLQELTDCFISGVPARDKEYGHSSRITFRVREDQDDITAGILELCPKGWFKSKSALQRSIYAVGCRVAFKILKESKGIKELEKQMEHLNKIGKALRILELEKDSAELQNRVLKHKQGSLQKRSKQAFEIEEATNKIKDSV